jgi:hypothetical protein
LLVDPQLPANYSRMRRLKQCARLWELDAMARYLNKLSCLSLICVLAIPTFGLAQKPLRKVNKTENPVVEAAKEQRNLSEAEVLAEVYVTLAGANHDYDGHRAAAMGQIHSAVKMLDHNVLKKGTPMQKAVALQEEKAMETAKAIAQKSATVHENQAVSDKQMQLAAKALANVRPTLINNKQKKILEHVDNAIKEIAIALKIR